MVKKLCILGGGRMGSALLGGLIASDFAAPEEFVVVEPRPEARALIAEAFPGIVVGDAPIAAEGAVLAMKPADAEVACRAIAPASFGRVLSIVAGVTLDSLEQWLWPDAVVIRAMPNTPALVREAATAIAPGRRAGDEDLVWAEHVLGAVGIVVRLGEAELDAVTGLSGSGPAYVFYLAEALEAAGVAAGLEAGVARTLTTRLILGAARMLAETGESAEALRAAVTSPHGTTEAGIAVLEERAVRGAFIAAVLRASARSKELGAPRESAI